ncbi:methyltransferase-like protein 23 isoform X2 [Ananas comosus]|uniref:Methyltransferase-like protein 23 isoform X2 n=1 Tax=Ananas comosus TaxID=4615 RepID=A0A6P5FDH3_ANACO|nr:methyltransferase-like protein 23 isoform X2 [Ananas comosus]
MDDAASPPRPPSAAHRSPAATGGGGGGSSSMTTISRHFFGGASSDEDHEFYVDIIENMQEDYGMFVWPCSIILAEYVWQQRLRFSGSTVVEVMKNMRSICNLNKVNCKILGITWGEWDDPIFDLNPSIVLGADVFYDSTDFDDLFATVAFLLQSSPGAVFITTYQNRSGHHLIEFLMVKWGLKCSKILDGFSFMPLCKASSLQGNIQLVEIELDT